MKDVLTGIVEYIGYFKMKISTITAQADDYLKIKYFNNLTYSPILVCFDKNGKECFFKIGEKYERYRTRSRKYNTYYIRCDFEGVFEK